MDFYMKRGVPFSIDEIDPALEPDIAFEAAAHRRFAEKVLLVDDDIENDIVGVDLQDVELLHGLGIGEHRVFDDLSDDGIQIALHAAGHEAGLHDAQHVFVHDPPRKHRIGVYVLHRQALDRVLVPLPGRRDQIAVLLDLRRGLRLLVLLGDGHDNLSIDRQTGKRQRGMVQAELRLLPAVQVFIDILQVEDHRDAELQIVADPRVGLVPGMALHIDLLLRGDPASYIIGKVIIHIEGILSHEAAAHADPDSIAKFPRQFDDLVTVGILRIFLRIRMIDDLVQKTVKLLPVLQLVKTDRPEILMQNVFSRA